MPNSRRTLKLLSNITMAHFSDKISASSELAKLLHEIKHGEIPSFLKTIDDKTDWQAIDQLTLVLERLKRENQSF